MILGLQDAIPSRYFTIFLSLCAVLCAVCLIWGIRRFSWPSLKEAIKRVDAQLAGRPFAALADQQAIGQGDAHSEAVWQAHRERMMHQSRAATTIWPDLKLSSKDLFGLRYIALLSVAVAFLFTLGGRVSPAAPANASALQLADSGLLWEGWIVPPDYTGKPTLYLSDLDGIEVPLPEGSMITLRIYGDPKEFEISESISGNDQIDQTDEIIQIEANQSGDLSIRGETENLWQISVQQDLAPTIERSGPIEVDADGVMSQAFVATDDYGIVAGGVVFELDISSVDRRFGLVAEPDPRPPITIGLPLPFSGDRADFEEVLVDDFSKHPWANLPVTVVLRVSDANDKSGSTIPERVILPGRRFFQPVARAIIEIRRDLLWAAANTPRAAQILRAISHYPEEVFPDHQTIVKVRAVIERLEQSDATLKAEELQGIAEELWDIALHLEEGALADARARLERAQQMLEEAIRNGASDEEISELMRALQEATDDYMELLAQQAEPSDGTDEPQQNDQGQSITMDELQALRDRIQELMEEGRMAEALALLEQYNELLENLTVTQGETGEDGPRAPGERAMDDLADTLRDQQELSDDAFRESQEHFNSGQDSAELQDQQRQQQGQNQAQDGQAGQGQSPGGDEETTSQSTTGEGSLADRQEALREGLNQLREAIPGLDGDAADRAERSLERAERAMDDAEQALRDDDFAEAIDRQAEALDALRDGLRNLGEALAENQSEFLAPEESSQLTENQGRPQPERRDPLGRQMGNAGQFGTEEDMLQDEIDRRANELLQELRDRSANQNRPQLELDYLGRLLERY